jgi:hypothetical protein
MKRIFTFAVAMLVAVTTADAGRKREKSGKVEGQTFTDAAHGFALTAGGNWNIKTMDADANFRVSFTQKKFEVPPDYLSAPDYTKVPRMIVWIDTTKMGAFAFLDSLVSSTYKSKQKSEVLKEFEILTEPKVLPKGRQPITVGSDKGVRWDGRAEYMKEVQTSASDVSGRRVKSAYMGSIYALKHGDKMLVFHLIGEEKFYDNIQRDALAIINSLTWPESAKN